MLPEVTGLCAPQSRIVLDYLGRYVRRTARGDSARVTVDDDGVTCRYRRCASPPTRFCGAFLQHVLQRRRHDMSPS